MTDACVVCGYPTVPGKEARRCLECIEGDGGVTLHVDHGDGHQKRLTFKPDAERDDYVMRTETLTKSGEWRTVGSQRVADVSLFD
jgi:hypothetical protein